LWTESRKYVRNIFTTLFCTFSVHGINKVCLK
jgi:hypothetical protein